MVLQKEINIGEKRVGDNCPCFIIAEAGVNHNGKPDIAKRLIDEAKACGADAVKFQTFRAQNLAASKAPKALYQLETTDESESQLEMLKKLELSEETFKELFQYCKQKEIIFLSSPFDEESADFLYNLGVSAFKIPSGEITNLSFLTHVASKGKPVILSTGMSTLAEVETAVHAIEKTGNTDIVLLHCTSNYPVSFDDVNLLAMNTLKQAFGYPVGYSDHTIGTEVSIAASVLGACVIEKHFTVDKTMQGPDHKASLEIQELKLLISGIRNCEKSLGHGRKIPTVSELNTKQVARKSLVANMFLSAGTVIKEDMISVKRPGTGLSPNMLHYIIGRKVKVDINKDDLLSLEMLG